jgi:histidinol phosphatase-like PHP family hydrolase
VRRAAAIGIPFCFGDDSHLAADVGIGISEAREYLLQNGIPSITTLIRESGEIARRVVPLR